VDTIAGQDHLLNRVRAAREKQKKQGKVWNIWVRPITSTYAALMGLELVNNAVSSRNPMKLTLQLSL
tara:strand:+ start:134 stop:334 length:201 start_codon:yes stop_codon:yes gene_type:complete